jgi:hypothetical protein
MAKARETRRSRYTNHLPFAVVLAVVFVLALSAVRYIQMKSGADYAAFGSYPDEPSHFLSGVMIRDYLVHGMKGSPLAWASDYYLHVPFFAVGYWPPFFYSVEALWMLLFGVGWIQAMWLSAAIAALTAATIFFEARYTVGALGALCAALIYLLWPPVQWSNCAVMTDTTVGLLSLWASIALGRYIETERTTTALLFGLFAALTILTKYSGLFLALIPLPALLLTRRIGLLRRLSFWVAPAVVLGLWLPWLLVTARYASRGLVTGDTGSLIFRLRAYLDVLLVGAGSPIGIILVAVWLCGAFMWKRFSGREIVWLLQPVAILLFLLISPIPVESRYLVPIFAPLVLLACSVTRHLTAMWRGARKTRLIALPALLILTAIYSKAAAFRFNPPRRDDVAPVAEFVLHGKGLRNASILAPADDEGRLIADVAVLDRSRGVRILARPNKLFASIDWNSSGYKTWCHTTKDVEAFFEASPIDLLVLHVPLRANAWPHERLLAEMVNQFPNRWRRVGIFPARSGSYEIFQFAKSASWGELSPLYRHRMAQVENVSAGTPMAGKGR